MITALEPRTRLTTEEAAKYLGLTVKTLHNRRSDGTGPVCFRIGRQYQYRVEDLERFIEKNRVAPIR
mgnify:CR=1 FL=1